VKTNQENNKETNKREINNQREREKGRRIKFRDREKKEKETNN
jgi:hypothetical protein